MRVADVKGGSTLRICHSASQPQQGLESTLKRGATVKPQNSCHKAEGSLTEINYQTVLGNHMPQLRLVVD